MTAAYAMQSTFQDGRRMNVGRDRIADTMETFRNRGGRAEHQLAVALEVERVNRLVQATAQPVLTELNVTFAGWQALTALSFDGRHQLPTAKLALRVGAHPTTITRTVDKLVRAGFVERLADPSDRRVQLVTLLPAGDAVQRKIMQHFDDTQFGMRDIPLEDLQEVAGGLRGIRQQMEPQVPTSPAAEASKEPVPVDR